MNWDDVKYFLAVAEAPSMRVAASSLKVSHSTVARRIDALEGELGVRLFDRMPSGYQLTAAGEELMPVALGVDESLHSFGRHIAGRDNELAGQVCVTVPDIFALELMMPYFEEFMLEYPDIQLKISDSFEVFDLSRREADIALRFTKNPPDHLIGCKIGRVKQAVYGRADYIKKYDLMDPSSGAGWIGWGTPEEKPHWLKKTPYPHLPLNCHFNNVLLQQQAVKRGLGLGYFPCFLGDTEENLVRLSEPEGYYDMWLLSHKDLRGAARMRAFRQFVISKIPPIKAALEGALTT
ncbi:LysR family transcriptional regulator [Kordiimonas laminariae]|uniref:LysR family transcriptional regulator n=1 Tax=Kordiimonas laminariae TaxID=2917717 RepID=UPI001FF3B836|nr:LysR family transcriptional regulator [Kordiimonas laminariae]MCK0070780.1 LysR family transcriptional regulator [Kordiimonas laminariae]